MGITSIGWRGIRWLGLASAVGASLVLTVVVVLASVARSIPPEPINLSQSSLMSFFADVAVSPDGDRVAVVWTEAYSDVVPPFGSVQLRWISESMEEDWRDRVTIFTGTRQACAEWASVAVSGTTAHLAYLVSRPCSNRSGGADTESIYYQTYDLLEGSAGVSRTVTTTAFVEPIPAFDRVDIALGGSGSAHFAYLYSGGAGTTEETTGTVYYRAFYSDTFETEEKLSGANARNPAMAWTAGRVHVVWGAVEGERWRIAHRCREGGVWESTTYPIPFYEENHPRHPAIVAQGDDVLVFWDWENWEGGEDQYVLAYSRYLTGTSPWLTNVYEVGTVVTSPLPLNFGDAGFRSPTYTYRSGNALDLYNFALRPTAALDRESLPVVVWQAYSGPGDERVDLYYSRALSISQSTEKDKVFVWSEPAILNRGTQGDSAVPKIALAPVVSPSVHVAYLQEVPDDWETYYRGEPEQQGDMPNEIFLPLVMRGYAESGGD